MKGIKEFLLSNGIENIYHLEKPFEEKVDNYIIYREKIIDRNHITRYQLEFDIISKSLSEVVKTQKKILEILDFQREQKIPNYHIKLLNGGGIAKDSESMKDDGIGEYHVILYFLVQK